MKNKIIVIISFLAGIFLLNSCLKDDKNYWVDDVAGKMYAQVAISTLQTQAMQPVPDTVAFSFMINIATDAPPASAITVTMFVDTAAVTAYNKQSGKSYKAFPNVRILNPQVIIAAGTRNAMVNCEVWGADQLNACDNYIAAVSIKTTSDPNIMIASNMKTNLLSLPISNPYAADYDVVSYRLHPTLGIFRGDGVQTFETVDCKTVIKHQMGDYPYDIKIEITENTIDVAGVTCFKCICTVIDPSTKQPVSGSQQFATFTGDATVPPIPLTNDVNYYDPIAQKFVLNVAYNAAAPRIAYEHCTRVK